MIRPRVLIVDDHQLFAEGLAQLLTGYAEIVGLVGDGSLVTDAVDRWAPDVILLDMSMPKVSGLEVLLRLREACQECKAIVLTMHRDARLAREALKAGACGVVLKESTGDELRAALDVVLRGGTYLASTLTADVAAIMSEPVEPSSARLTTRQREVLRLIVQGRRVNEIAEALDVPPHNVESLKYQIMQHLNVHSTAELVRYVVQHDLVSVP